MPENIPGPRPLHIGQITASCVPACQRFLQFHFNKQRALGAWCVCQAHFECQDINDGHGGYLAPLPSYPRPGFYISAAMDLFGKASMDPYAFGA